MFVKYEVKNGKLKKFRGLDAEVITPDDVTKIGEDAFKGCRNLVSVTLSDNVTEIENWAFDRCFYLTSVFIPGSVTKVKGKLFFECPNAKVICQEGTYIHRYCERNKLPFLFDYQFEAFHGVIPLGMERLASPFLADEEKPYVFISYSHKDRDEVLPIIKKLYEAGWKIWYDEGLTIGDKYDETLEAHVENCAAFLLFLTNHSVESIYVQENEIPWALSYGKPIIKCVLEEGFDVEIPQGAVTETVSSSEIEAALEKVSGLEKGERREAKGISVVVNPVARNDSNEGGYAYCLYAEEHAAMAKAIMLQLKDAGCALYDAVQDGEEEEKLRSSASLIVFLDKAFLSDVRLAKILSEEYQAGKDIAICQIEVIEEDDLPPDLAALHEMQWLNYAFGLNPDMNVKLARHLQKRGCRDTSVIPGFRHKRKKQGIVTERYTGMSPELSMEREYAGIPVITIGKGTFKNCMQLKKVVIPEYVTSIEESAFEDCQNLITVTLPDGLTEIGDMAFRECKNLCVIVIPESVETIGRYAFKGCRSIRSVTVPGRVEMIGVYAFQFCEQLQQVTIREGVKQIGHDAFGFCLSLKSIIIPDSVTEIDDDTFRGCSDFTVFCSRDSYAWEYCEKNGMKLQEET